jgi:hypothetical protein
MTDSNRAQLPPTYIDTEHIGSSRELLRIFYTACLSEGGTADEVTLRGLRAVIDSFLVRPTDEEILRAVRPLYGDQIAADMGAEDDLRTAHAILDSLGYSGGITLRGQMADTLHDRPELADVPPLSLDQLRDQWNAQANDHHS